jgi:hypothetical protein
METLAYAHLHTAYEEADLNPAAYELKLFNNFNWQPPSSAWIRFLSTVMAISVLSMAGSALAAYVRTNGSPLNIRATPGGAVIGSLRNGTYIGITGSTSSGWSQLTTGGWVSSRVNQAKDKTMNISDLDILEVVSEETSVEGGYAYADAYSNASAYGNYFASTYTSTYTSASSGFDYYSYQPYSSAYSSSGSSSAAS